MQSVSGLMREYFSPVGHDILHESLPKDVPIEPKKTNWTITSNPESLLREFSFKNDEKMRRFINELLLMQEEVNHHAQILMEDKVVKVKVRTKTLNRVTEIDIEYASQLDRIYEDVNVESESSFEYWKLFYVR